LILRVSNYLPSISISRYFSKKVTLSPEPESPQKVSQQNKTQTNPPPDYPWPAS